MPNWVGQPLRFLFLLFLGTVSLIFVFLVWQTWKDTCRDFAYSTEALVELYAQTTRDSLAAYEAQLRVLGETLAGMDEKTLQTRGRALIERIKEQNPGLAGFGLARPDGQLVLVTDFPPGTPLPSLTQIPETRDSFLKALDSRHMVLGRTYFFKLFYEWVVPFRFTIRDPDGKPRWVMTSAFLLGSDAVPGSSLQLKEGQSISLVRGDGYLQSMNPPEMEQWYWVFSRPMPQDHLQSIKDAVARGSAEIWLDELMLAARYLPAYDLYVLSEQTLAPLYQEFQMAVWPQLTAYLGLLLLGYAAYRLAWSTHLASIRQRELHVERMRELALRDPLTGLPNRQALRRWLDTRISGEQRLQLNLYTCELFHLARIREGYGYGLGEDLVRAIARQLQTLVPDAAFLARVEENRFVIVVPAGEGAVDEQALQQFFRQPFSIGQQTMHCPALISQVRFPEDGDSVEALSQASIIALAEARKDPYGKPGRFQARQLRRSQYRLQIANRLQAAIEEQQLTLVYQPQVCLQSRKILGMEALLRWQDAQLGEVSPADFIPVAEEMGMIQQLGQYVLQRALRECCRERERLSGMRLAVNVCADELHRVTYWQDIRALLRGEDWPAECLELEMTERLLVESSEKYQQTWDQSHDLGVRLAIDDFGTGYSSLAYLARIPVHMMKIDRMFIDYMLESENYRTLVQAMIGLGQSLGLEVLAEGVETGEQLRLLQSLGCDQAQGYFIARPMPLKALLHWMDSQNDWVPGGIAEPANKESSRLS